MVNYGSKLMKLLTVCLSELTWSTVILDLVILIYIENFEYRLALLWKAKCMYSKQNSATVLFDLFFKCVVKFQHVQVQR